MTTISQDGSDTVTPAPRSDTFSSSIGGADPLDFGRHRRANTSSKQIKLEHPKGDKKRIKKYYTRQNRLIDQFLGAEDEEANKIEEDVKYKPKIKFAVNASFTVNLFLFAIQMYAAISTGSLSVCSSLSG